jgi:hypothetical protein
MERESLTKEWQQYDGNYCKAMQDIRLKNGDEVIKCWPNAGLWMTFKPGKYYKKDIPNSDVTHVRETDDPEC